MFSKVLIFLVLFVIKESTLAQSRYTNQASSTTTTMRPSSTMPSSIATPSTTPGPDMPMPRKPDWTINGPTGSCILLAGNISFSVTYNTLDGSTNTGKIPIPKNATATGDCTGFLNKLTLTWPGMTAGGVNNVTMLFIKRSVYAVGNDTGIGSYGLTTVFGQITSDFPDAAPGQVSYISAKPTDVLNGDLQTSYKCVSPQSVAADNTGNAYLEFEDVQGEAFHTGAASEFGPEIVCAVDTATPILSILGYVIFGVVVASVLAGLTYMLYKRAGYSAV